VARRKTGRRQGRPGLADAKRRTTTRQGRRTGFDPVDGGSERLRAKKRAATTREDTELTPAGILYGRGHLDNAQYSALAFVTLLLLRRVTGAMGGNLSVAAFWQSMLAAATSGQRGASPVIGDAGARNRLARICRSLDGSRELVLELAAEQRLPPICVRAAEHRLTARDLVQLELLRKSLDGISAAGWWAAEA
jgi:hypothetical protein